MKKKILLSLWFWVSLLGLAFIYGFIIPQYVIPYEFKGLFWLSIAHYKQNVLVDLLLIYGQFLFLVSLFFHTIPQEKNERYKLINRITLFILGIPPIFQTFMYILYLFCWILIGDGSAIEF